MTEEELEALLEPTAKKPLVAGSPMAPTEPEKGLFESITSGIADSFTGGAKRQGMEERGISMEGADLGVRAVGGMPTDDPSRSRAAMKAIEEQDEKTIFKFDKPSGRMTFSNDSTDNVPTAIDPPGMEMGDFAEIFGDAPAMTGATLGYILQKRIPASKKFWRGLKKLAGLGGGAFVGEAAREGINVQTGAYDQMPEEGKNLQKFLYEPGKAAGLEILGAGTMRALGGTYKTIKGYMQGNNIPGLFRERGLLITDRFPEAVTDINKFLEEAGLPERFKPDSARILNDPEFMAALDMFAKNRGLEGHDAIRELYEKNVGALESAVDASGAKAIAGDATAYEAGSAVSRAIEGQTATAEGAMAGRVAEQSGEAKSSLGEVEQRATTEGTSEPFGAGMREVAEKENKDLADWADKTYGPLAKEAGDMKFFHTNLAKEADKQIALFDDDIAKTLTEENQRLVLDIRKNINVLRETPTGGKYEAPKTSSFQQQQRLISQLKRAEREINKGNLPGLEISALRNLRTATMADRTARLLQYDAKNKTNLAMRLQKADKEYAIRKDKAARGTLGKLMKYTEGRPRVKDSQVFSTVFGPDKTNAAAAREFSETLTGSDKYLGELQEMKSAIFGDFMKNVSRNGVIDPNRAAKYLADRKSTLGNYLNPDEIAILAKSGDEASLLSSLTDRQTQFQRAINKGELRGVAPSKIFKTIFKSPESIEMARRTLQKSFPQEWSMIQAAAKDNVKRSMMAFDTTLERRAISFPKMNKLLDDPEYVDKLKAMFGDEYVSNLEMVRQAAAIQGRSPDLGKVNIDLNNKWVDLIRNVAFGPLNHRNFIIKKVTKFKHGIQMDNLMDMILDPVQLNNAAKSMNTSEGMKNLQVLFGGGAAKLSQSGSTDESYQDTGSFKLLMDSIRNNANLKRKIQQAVQ